MQCCRTFEEEGGNYHWPADLNYVLFIDAIFGGQERCGISWETIDRVFFPMLLGEEGGAAITHYFLGVFHIDEHRINIYDSFYDKDDQAVKAHVDCYARMIVSLLEFVNFHMYRASYGSVYAPLKYDWVNCPKQSNMYDCDAFVLKYVEPIMYGNDVSKMKCTQLKDYRFDWATNLWSHARFKSNGGYDTPPEKIGDDYHEYNSLHCEGVLGKPFSIV